MRTGTPAAGREAPRDRLGELLAVFGRLGVLGFGGPMAHLALLEREVVTRRGWLSRQRFLDALAATNLVPGPNSTEMAIHVGYARAGVAGGLLSGVAFILPAFGLMLGLSWAYFRWSDVAAVGDLFYGVKPAVIAVVTLAALRLGRAALADWKLAAILAASGALAYAYSGWEPVILLAAGFLGIGLYAPPRPSSSHLALALPVALAAGVPALAWRPDALVDLTLLFLRAGGLLFGGGYVMIPLIEHDVVDRLGWMTRQQFLDGVALGQATPGPIVITATFVGYKAAGLPGAAAATAAVFAPAFFFAMLLGRMLDTLRRSRLAQAFLKGIGAAVVGTILAVTAHLAREAFVDGWTIALGLGALAALLLGRADPVAVIVGGGLAGLALGPLR